MFPILIMHGPFSCHTHPTLVNFPLAGVYLHENKVREETKYEVGSDQHKPGVWSTVEH